MLNVCTTLSVLGRPPSHSRRSRIRLNHRLRNCCKVFFVNFAAHETRKPWKVQACLRSREHSREQIYYQLTRYRNVSNKALHPTNALLLRLNQPTLTFHIYPVTVKNTLSGQLSQKPHSSHLSTTDALSRPYRALCRSLEITNPRTRTLFCKGAHSVQKS